MANILEIIIRGRDQFTPAGQKAQGTARGLKGAMGGLGKTVLGVAGGFIAAQASIAGVQKIMSASIGAAMKFEHQMATIRALTGATKKDTNLLEGAIKDMARTMPKSPAELGAAAYFILSSGIEDAADAAGVLKIAAKASTIGLGETEKVADALTTVLNAYGLSADKAGWATDVMIAAVKEGKAEADAFAGVLGRVVPLAAQMGISFEEVSANLATFTLLGVSAEEAATGLRAVMSSLLKPTTDQTDAMAELGLSAEDLRQQIREKGLLATLDAMMTATGGNEAAVARLFPNIRALTSVLGTAGVQMDSYKDILAATEDAAGGLEKGFAIVSETAQFKMKVAMGELNIVLMELGQEALPAVVAGLGVASGALILMKDVIEEALTPFIDMIQFLIDAQKEWESFSGTATTASERVRDSVMDIFYAGEKFPSFNAQMKEAAERIRTLGGTESDIKAIGKALEDAGVIGAKTFREEIALIAWTEFDRQLASADSLTVELARNEKGLARALDDVRASLADANQQLKDNLSLLSDITGQRTQEAVALDIQINALEQERNAALQAEAGQERLGTTVESTTDALGKQIGALDNLAASMVPQALNNEVIALERELKVLELGRLKIEAQINARNRLATAQLAMARVANLPALAKQKELELERAKILQKVGGNTEKLTDAQKEQIAAIDAEIQALQTNINVKTLEAELTNLQAEASDKNREAMQRELNEIIDQIGATGDLKRQRDLYIETLVPVQLLQEIDELGREKAALDNSKVGAEGATGAHQTLSDVIGDQIGKLELERGAIDLVTRGWKLQAEAMLELPTREDIYKDILAWGALLRIQARMAALAPELAIIRAAGPTGATVPMQHGGIVTRPTLALIGERGPEAVIPLDRGAGQAVGRPIHIEPHFHFEGIFAGDELQMEQLVQQALPEMRRQIEGALA